MKATFLIFGAATFVFGEHVLAQHEFIDPQYARPCGQKVHRHVEPFIEKLFCWEDWEIAKTIEEKRAFLKKLPTGVNLEHHYYYDEETNEPLDTLSPSPYSIHFIDYDRDGREDLIHAFWVPWQKTFHTTFWRQEASKWQLDFRLEGEIVEIDLEAGKPWFKTYHALCCGDYTHYLKNYHLNTDKTQLTSYSLTSYLAFIDDFKRIERQLGQKIELDSGSISLSNGDTLFSISGMSIHSHKQLLRNRKRTKPIAILGQDVNATGLMYFTGSDETKLALVALPQGTKLAKHAYLKDHRKGTLPEPDSIINYIGWIKQ